MKTPFDSTLVTAACLFVCGGMPKVFSMKPLHVSSILPHATMAGNPKFSPLPINRATFNCATVSDSGFDTSSFLSKNMSNRILSLSPWWADKQIEPIQPDLESENLDSDCPFVPISNETHPSALVENDGEDKCTFVAPTTRINPEFLTFMLLRGMTSTCAYAVRRRIGWLIGAFFIASLLMSRTSMADEIATPISTAIPSIKSHQPNKPSPLCGLSSPPIYLSFSQSANFSIANPMKTIHPPAAAVAMMEKVGNDEDSKRAKLIRFAWIAWGTMVAVGVLCAAFISWCYRH